MIYMDDDTIEKIAESAELMVGAYDNNSYRKDACAEVSYHCPGVDQNILVSMWIVIDAWVNAHPEDK